MSSSENVQNEITPAKRFFSALFYGGSSILIMIINKSILTKYNDLFIIKNISGARLVKLGIRKGLRFPSAQFLGLGQMISAVLILLVGKLTGAVSFPSFNMHIPKQLEFDKFAAGPFLKFFLTNLIFPLPLFYLGNLISGLGGTKQISLPMFTVLRRFTILLTMLLEIFVLGKRPSYYIVVTVLSMIAGSIIAASDDLAFDFLGYVYVFCNDIFTASNNVYMKKKLNDNDLGKYGIIFYNTVFMIFPCFFLVLVSGDFQSTFLFDNWNNSAFLFQFFLSCIMGFVINFSVTLCTAYNSALTTTVVGCIKNIAITYIGMFFGGDYIFSITNFVGINISIVGGVAYSYIAFLDKQTNVKKMSSDLKLSA